MAKIGRNAPYPCGSGKKYKKCCLPAEQAKAADTANEKQRQLEAARASRPKGPPMPKDFFIEDDERFVEETCKLLKERYPGMIGCPDRRALLCEARGEHEQAITYSERCIEIVAKHPEDYDPPALTKMDPLVLG